MNNTLTNGYEYGDGYGYAHHVLDPPLIPRPSKKIYMHFDILFESYSTVDQQYISDLINIQMGMAIVGAVLQSSGTLGGLMTGISLGAPSIVAVMICISIMTIEMGSANTSSNFATTTRAIVPPTVESDATIASVAKTKEYFFREIKLDNSLDYSRAYNIKPWIFNSLPRFLGAFLLFDKMRKLMPIKDKDADPSHPTPFYQYQINAAINIANTVIHNEMTYPCSYIPSFANAICPLLLQVSVSSCNYRGGYQLLKQYNTPMMSVDKNSHNVLFRNSFPRLFKPNGSTVNNYISLCYRYLFYSQFSNLTTLQQFTSTLRKAQPKTLPFKEYIFDVNMPNITDPTLSKLSQDAIPLIINHVERRDLEVVYDTNITKLYDEIISTATQVFNIFNKYMAKVDEKPCVTNTDYPFGRNTSTVDIDTMITNISSKLIPSAYATDTNPVTGLTSKFTPDMHTNGYKLMRPLIGSATDNANLISGFLGIFSARSMADIQLRQYTTKHTFGDSIDKVALALKNDYDQTLGLIEGSQPDQKQQELSDIAEGLGGSLESVKDYLQIPNILGTINKEQSSRGTYTKI